MTVKNKVVAGATAVVFTLSTAGLDLIKRWEGTKQNAYLDAVGVPTICTGSTRGVFLGQYATLGECEQRLVEDTSQAGKAIHRLVKVKLTQEQYDALVSLTFNIGEGNLAKSTLLRRVNSNQCVAAVYEFGRWVYAKGRKLKGLVARREAEAALYMTGCTYVPEVPLGDSSSDAVPPSGPVVRVVRRP